MVPLLVTGIGLGMVATFGTGQTQVPDVSKKLAQDWLKRVTTKLKPDEAELVARAQATLLGNLIEGKPWAPYLGVMPSLGTYRGVWNWDSAFHAQGISLWDPKLARDQFRILFDKQLPTGALPDVIFEDGKIVTDFTKPPVFAWALAVVDRRSKDTAFLKSAYPKLVKVGEFFEQHRGGASDGLFFYGGGHAGMDSGWDDSIRWDGGYQASSSDDKRLWAVDLNCYMVSHYRALAYIASRLGKHDEQKSWEEKATALAKQINDRLWDDKIGAYVDRDRFTHANGPALSPAAFMPLFVHIAPPDRAARLAKLAADPTKFYPGMPTAAYDTPGFEPHGYWRGSAWLNTSFFAIKGLKDYGFTDLASKMRSTLLGWVEKNKDTIYEYYDSKNGEGAGAKAYGWSSTFILSFVFDWDNDHLTWLFSRVP